MFSLKGRESEPSQLVLLCFLALFDASQLHKHVHVDAQWMYYAWLVFTLLSEQAVAVQLAAWLIYWIHSKSTSM